jgi:hypothetical protein
MEVQAVKTLTCPRIPLRVQSSTLAQPRTPTAGLWQSPAMSQANNDALRQSLRKAVQAARDDVRHPWYSLRPEHDVIPDDVTEEIVAVSLRRWRSNQRREGGRRDPVADLAKGLHEHFAGIDWPDARADFHSLAERMAAVLRSSP